MAPDITVSFSRNAGFNPRDHNDFLVAHGPFQNVPNFLTKRAWSPVVFKDGRRKRANFLSSSLVALDFDSGEWSCGDAVKYAELHNYMAVVATTKSHSVAKDGKPACDRFRLVIAAEKTTSLDDYEYTMKRFMFETPADKACKDGGRFFFPCKSVYWTKFEGTLAQWSPCPYEDTAAGREEAYGTVDEDDMRNLVTLPHYVWTYIVRGAASERHKAAYMVACELTKRGFTEEEIMTLLKRHRSPLLDIGEGKDHVSRCIWNGAARVRDEQAKRRREGLRPAPSTPEA
jgi:hypothetical protein